MTKLRIELAPSPRVPLRFLLTVPAWGAVAGAMLIAGGDALLLSRWAPATLALVHALTLGVLGNAMIGSLLQFLPAAAGVPTAGGPKRAGLLHGLLNAGTAALLPGFWLGAPMLLTAAAVLLAAAFALLAAMTLPGLLRAAPRGLPVIGIAIAIACGAIAATLGARMALGLAGHTSLGLPLLPWADVHAAWGVFGWALLLLACVSQTVMPMFQGTNATRPALHAGGLAFAVGGLLLGSAMGHAVLRWTLVLGVAGFAGEALWRQARRPRPGNAGLVRAWRDGLLVLVASALLLAADAPAVVIGTLVVAVALPLLVVAMQLEIVAFLGWIGLRRGVARGNRIPGVEHLLPARSKARVLAAFRIAAVVLAAAALWPHPALAHGAGVALAGAYVVLMLVLVAVGRRCRRVLAAFPARPAGEC